MTIFHKVLKSLKKILGIKRKLKKKKSSSKPRKISPKSKTFKASLKKSSQWIKTKKQIKKDFPKEIVLGPVVGRVTHFFDRIQVAVIRIDTGQILKGETIVIRGKTTKEIRQKVSSMQVESVDVAVAKKGQLIGLKVIKPVRVGDEVLKVLK